MSVEILFVKYNNILTKLQSGFRKSNITVPALVNLFSDLIDAKDEGSCRVSLDYPQAINLINHDLLAEKMSYLGFDNKTIK